MKDGYLIADVEMFVVLVPAEWLSHELEEETTRSWIADGRQ